MSGLSAEGESLLETAEHRTFIKDYTRGKVACGLAKRHRVAEKVA